MNHHVHTSATQSMLIITVCLLILTVRRLRHSRYRYRITLAGFAGFCVGVVVLIVRRF
ncbi:hypothetical protein [Spirosoma areae]